MNSKFKSALKSVTWRITASATTMLLVYFMSGDLKVASAVASAEIFVKMIVYYIHERVWEKVPVQDINIVQKEIASTEDKN